MQNTIKCGIILVITVKQPHKRATGPLTEVKKMKEGIHPKYETCKIICACGEVVETKSTKGGDIHVEICSKCHPFYTGKQKLVDTGGRVDKFKKRLEANK